MFLFTYFPLACGIFVLSHFLFSQLSLVVMLSVHWVTQSLLIILILVLDDEASHKPPPPNCHRPWLQP